MHMTGEIPEGASLRKLSACPWKATRSPQGLILPLKSRNYVFHYKAGLFNNLLKNQLPSLIEPTIKSRVAALQFPCIIIGGFHIYG